MNAGAAPAFPALPAGPPLVASAAGRGLLGAAALVGAVGLGAALALHPTVGLALVAAAAYGAVFCVDLRLAIALWVPVVFLEGVPALNAGGKAAGGLLAFGWLVSAGRLRVGRVVRAQPAVFAAVVLLAVWLSLTVVWAVDVGTTVSALGQWYAVVVVFVVVATAMARPAAATGVAAAFVAGAVLSVLVGAAAPGIGTAEEGRFQGTAGDPNLLAAGAVPAVVLALALARHAGRAGVGRAGAGRAHRRALWRAAVVAAVAVLAAGFVASGSRGGLVGAGVALAAALVAFPRRRGALLASAVLALGVVAVSVLLFPSTWERSSSVGSGSGRGDLWTVAWHMAGDHPVTGVGLDNYPEVAGDYARRVGPLQGVDIIAAEPHEAHNLYLQLLAESGVVGLALFAAFAGGCLWSAWVAARRFGAWGDDAHATLARAVLVAGAGMLASSFFISAAVDRRLWILLALGPALRAAAAAAVRVSPASAGR